MPRRAARSAAIAAGSRCRCCAIALGVALGFAVALINEAAIAEFTERDEDPLRACRPRGARTARRLRRNAVPTTRARSRRSRWRAPSWKSMRALRDATTRCASMASMRFRAAAVTPAFVGAADDPLDVLRPGVVFVSPAAAAWLGIQPGGTLVVQTGVRDTSLAVAGFARADSGERYAVMDIAAAQDAFARGGVAVAHRSAGAPGRRRRRAARAYRARAAARRHRDDAAGQCRGDDADVASVPRESQRARARRAVHRRAARVFHAGVVGGPAPCAFRVAAHARPFARAACRAAGRRRRADRRDRSVGRARRRLRARPRDVARIRRRPGRRLLSRRGARASFDPAAALVFGLVGIAVAMLGSLVPAREAARATPAAALKAGDEQQAFARLRNPRSASRCSSQAWRRRCCRRWRACRSSAILRSRCC